MENFGDGEWKGGRSGGGEEREGRERNELQKMEKKKLFASSYLPITEEKSIIKLKVKWTISLKAITDG